MRYVQTNIVLHSTAIKTRTQRLIRWLPYTWTSFCIYNEHLKIQLRAQIYLQSYRHLGASLHAFQFTTDFSGSPIERDVFRHCSTDLLQNTNMCPRRPLVCVRIQQQYRRQNGPRNARFSSKAIKRKSIKVMWTVQRYWQTRVKQHSRCLQSVNWSSAGENSNLTELLSLCVCWKENSSWVKVFFYWPHSLSVWLSANVCIHILKEAETWRKKLLFQPEQTGPGIKVGAWTSLMFQISYLWVIFAYNCFSKYCCSFTPALPLYPFIFCHLSHCPATPTINFNSLSSQTQQRVTVSGYFVTSWLLRCFSVNFCNT